MDKQAPTRAGRRPLDRETILRTAVGLVERKGLDALTMRRLGAALGCEAMSIYYYVDGKDALLDGVVEIVVAGMDLSWAERSGPWQERLKEGYRAYRRLAHTHPGVFPLIGRPAGRTLAGLRPVEAFLSVLREAGYPPRAALQAHRTLSSYVYGYAISEIRGLGLESDGQLPIEESEWQSLPSLAEALAKTKSVDHDREFNQGLDAIVSGLSPSERRG
jgi:TetR/AcrR family transcriptional regulator, tetracycline repressor protein